MGSKTRHIRRQMRRVQVALGIIPTGSLGRVAGLNKKFKYNYFHGEGWHCYYEDMESLALVTDPHVEKMLVQKYIKVGFKGSG